MTMKCIAAQELGRLNKGKKKRFAKRVYSPEELAKRGARLIQWRFKKKVTT